MRKSVVVLSCFLTACTADPGPGPTEPGDAVAEDTSALDVLVDTGLPSTDDVGAGITTDSAVDDTAQDVDGAAESDVEDIISSPFAGVSSHFLLTSGDVVLMDATFDGYAPNAFGAEVYGQMLKIWASQGQTGAEILVRLGEVSLPGSVTPGAPGSAAWVVVLVEGADAYVTQLATGTVQIDVCPDTPGLMVTGQLNQLVLFTTSGVGYQTMSASAEFEVVLGQVHGEVPCTP